MPFFVIFFLIPLLELTVFVYATRFIGLGTTLLLCLLTALGGGAMVRHQGLQALMSVRKEMERGVMPSTELYDGLCIVAAGALLLTPGFVTDTLGFLLLIPAVRAALRTRMARSARFQSVHFTTGGYGSNSDSGPFKAANDPSVIEGEYEKVDERSGPGES